MCRCRGERFRRGDSTLNGKGQPIEQKLQWFKITGQSVGEKQIPVVAFVEATSREKVLKYHGGRRKEVFPNGKLVVQFPTRPEQVQVLGKTLVPDRLQTDPEAIVAVIPVTRYQCECGKVHVSEYPYPSMWCSCGKKAFPVRN